MRRTRPYLWDNKIYLNRNSSFLSYILLCPFMKWESADVNMESLQLKRMMHTKRHKQIRSFLISFDRSQSRAFIKKRLLYNGSCKLRVKRGVWDKSTNAVRWGLTSEAKLRFAWNPFGSSTKIQIPWLSEHGCSTVRTLTRGHRGGMATLSTWKSLSWGSAVR